MKRLVLAFVLVLLCSISFSQIRIDWQQCYGSFGMDYSCGIAKKEGGYWVAGYVEEQSGMVAIQVPYWSWAIEIDDVGNLKKQIELGCYARQCEDFFKAYSGEYYFATGLPPNELGKEQLGIKKIDDNGDVIWETMVGNKDYGFWENALGNCTSDGGAIATTPTMWSGGDITNYYGMYDAWVVKVDSLGNLEWETTLGTDRFEEATSFTLTSDGGYYVTIIGCPGYTGSIPVCHLPSTDEYDCILVKLDSEGNLLWSRCYGGSKHDGFNNVLELEDGFLLACYTESEDRDAEGAGYHFGYYHDMPYLGQTNDIWLIRTDADGNIIWSRCYGGTGMEFPTKAFLNEDGGFTVFGTTQSIDGDAQSAQNLYAPTPYDEYVYHKLWLFRIDSDGNLLWERAIGTKMHTNIYLDDVVKLSDTEYTILATAHPPAAGCEGDFNCTNWDDRLCGYESYWVLHITDIFDYDGVEELQTGKIGINVYPNPATTWVAFDYTLPGDAEKATLTLTNALGVKVAAYNLSGNQGQKVLDLREFANGVYTITVLCGEYYQTVKLVITK